MISLSIHVVSVVGFALKVIVQYVHYLFPSLSLPSFLSASSNISHPSTACLYFFDGSVAYLSIETLYGSGGIYIDYKNGIHMYPNWTGRRLISRLTRRPQPAPRMVKYGSGGGGEQYERYRECEYGEGRGRILLLRLLRVVGLVREGRVRARRMLGPLLLFVGLETY
jgi:hypothetical protein